MKATTLEQVIQFFDAQRPLSGQSLQQWFIERPGRTRRRLVVFFNTKRHKPTKALLIGHRGSGKSTELNKLALELRENYEPIFIDLLDHISTSDVRYEDLMLTMGIEITRTCIEKGLIAPTPGDRLSDAWKTLRNWWQEMVAGSMPSEPGSAIETYGELSLFLGKISVGAKSSSFSREHMVEQINRQMPDLIANLQTVIQAAEATLNPRQLLVIVEGTDKIDLASARHIFFDHAKTVTSLNTAMIYTFPLALYRSGEFNTITRNLDAHEFLHNIGPYKHDNSQDQESMRALRKLVRVRLEEALIEEAALDDLLRASGGVLAHLVRLISSAALFTLTRPQTASSLRIESRDAQDAVRALRDDLSASLSLADWRRLAEVRNHRMLTNDEAMERLLFSGAVVQYTNHNPWCDVHPALWPALRYYTTEQDGE